MKWNRLTLKTRLIIGFAGASLFGLALLGGVGYYITSNLVRTMTLESLQKEIRGVASAIKISLAENIEQQQSVMDNWAPQVVPKLQFAATVEMKAQNQVNQEFRQVKIPRLKFEDQYVDNNQAADRISKMSGEAVTFFVNSSEGLVRVSTSVRKADGSRATGTFIPKDSPVYQHLAGGKRFIGRAKVVGEWYVTAYEPVIRNNELVGAFFVGSKETSYVKIKDYLKTRKLLDTGYFFILDTDGRLALHPAKENELVINDTDLDGRLIFQDMLKQKTGVIEYSWLNAETKKPQEKVALFQHFPEMNWLVAASLNKAEAEFQLDALKKALGLVVGGVLALLIIVAYLFGHKMSANLQRVSEQLDSVSTSLGERSAQLQTSSQTLASSSTEAAASIEETVASIEEINAQIKNNSQVALDADKIGQATLSTARDGEQKMASLIQSMGQIQADSKRVQDMSSLIDEIAFQTNLLALNAAVEAARAGEQGRGFAVVAEAVRGLAVKTAESAKEITSLISESHTRISEGVRVAEGANKSLADIVSNVVKLSSLVGEVATSSHEQSRGIDQINTGMNQLDTATQTNASSAEEVSSSSTELASQSEVLREAVVELRELIHGSSAAEAVEGDSAVESTSARPRFKSAA